MTHNVDKSGRHKVHPIDQLAILTIDQRQALKLRWLTTVEALIAASATPEARAGLVHLLGCDSEDFDELLSQAKTMLGDERYCELVTPCAGGPTGALSENPAPHPQGGQETQKGHG